LKRREKKKALEGTAEEGEGAIADEDKKNRIQKVAVKEPLYGKRTISNTRVKHQNRTFYVSENLLRNKMFDAN